MNLWPSHLLGLDNVSGHWYAWWSGVASFVGAASVYARRHNCHHHLCWRFGHHKVKKHGHRYVACRKHAGAPKLGKEKR